jgi:hypothetical protein
MSPLARELIVVLIVKAALLALLWWAFFRAPAAPHFTVDAQRIEQRILVPSPAAEIPHADR